LTLLRSLARSRRGGIKFVDVGGQRCTIAEMRKPAPKAKARGKRKEDAICVDDDDDDLDGFHTAPTSPISTSVSGGGGSSLPFSSSVVANANRLVRPRTMSYGSESSVAGGGLERRRGSMMTYKTRRWLTIMRVAGSATSAMR
jgi:hypothetical protein